MKTLVILTLFSVTTWAQMWPNPGPGVAPFNLFPSALLNLGAQDPSLNASFWYTPGRNQFNYSTNLTGASWIVSTATKDDATHVTFTAQNGYVKQDVATDVGRQYTLFATIAQVTGNIALHWYHAGLIPASTALTITGTLTDYAVTVTGDGGTVNFGIQDQNAAGWGQIEVTRWAVIPGTHTAVEASAIYEQTGPKPGWFDYASGGNDGCFGGNCIVATTSDPSTIPWDYNDWGPQSRTDLTDSDWTATTATVTATTFTPTAQNGGVTIIYTGTSGASYLVSAELSSVGNLGLQWTTGATNPAVTVTGTPTRYSVAYTGTGAAENIGLRDGNAAGWGAITATDWQIEQVPSGTTTPSVYSAEATTLVADFDGTDDYVEVNASLTSARMTMAVAFRIDQPGNNGAIVSTEPTLASGLEGMGIRYRVASVVWLSPASGSPDYLGGSVAIPTGVWVIVLSTYDGTTASLYVNGALDIAAARSWSMDSTESLRAGMVPVGGDFAYGNIHPPKIWSRAFSASEATTVTCQYAGYLWDYNSIPVWGAQANCPALDFTTAPLYAGLTGPQIQQRWLNGARMLWAALFPRPEVWEYAQ